MLKQVVAGVLLCAGAVSAADEIRAEFDELRRAAAESANWNRERIVTESVTPEAAFALTEPSAVETARKRVLALAQDLAQAGVDVSAEKTAVNAVQGDDFEAYQKIAQIRRKLVFKNPLLDFSRILFLKHNKMVRGEVHMIDQYLGFNQAKGGGVFVLENPFGDKPEVKSLLDSPVVSGRLKGRKLGDEGSFVSLDLDYNASRIAFAYTEAEWGAPCATNKEGVTKFIPDDWDWTNQPAGDRKSAGQPGHAKFYYWKPESAFHIFSMNADGSELKQLTDGMWNDTDPVFLPNGRFAFVSERDVGQTRCSGRAVPCTVLNGMMADGSDIFRLSWHETTEWHPSVDNAGMIVYTRWDYVDRDSDVAHHPWTCFPDGRNPRAFHGNYPLKREVRPWMEMSIRAVPGSPLYMAVAAPHHGQAYGSVVLVDPRVEDDHAMSQVKRVTPEYIFPESEELPGVAMKRGQMISHKNRTSFAEPFGTPWPLSEKYFLAVYTRNYKKEPYGIYLCDIWGNRELLYRDDTLSALDPIPFKPRQRPPVIEPQTKQAKADRGRNEPMPLTGEVAILDVYDSLQPWPEGSQIKELRVVAVFPKDTFHAEEPQIGVSNQSLARAVLGTVPVEDDGSVYFTVPAGCEIYFQALDAEGTAVQTMRSGTYVHPGERLTCSGCHERRTSAAVRKDGKIPKAFAKAPLQLKPEVDGTVPVFFPKLVQPVLDKHCVACHQKNPKAPSLLGAPGSKKWGWSQSYESLTKNHARTNSMAWSMCGGNGVCIAHNELQYSIPGQIGAKASKLYKMLKAGHGGVKLSAEEMRRITCWLDCNSVFYGAYHDIEKQRKGEAVLPKLGNPPIWKQGGVAK